MSIFTVNFFVGKRLYILDYVVGFPLVWYKFAWMPLLQVWRGNVFRCPHASWVTDDYGNLIEIGKRTDVTQVTLH